MDPAWALLKFRARFENRRLESRLQAELRRDRLKAGLQTELDLIGRFVSNTLSGQPIGADDANK